MLDPYFSATKMAWLLEEGGFGEVADSPYLALGTVDSWVLWNLTGGVGGGLFATDPTNASRTLLYDIDEHRWSDELCELFGVPRRALRRGPPVVRAVRVPRRRQRRRARLGRESR